MRWDMRLRVTTRAVAALVSLGRTANANGTHDQTSSLSWVELPGAEACGGAAALAKPVEQRLGRAALVSPAQADLSIEGRAEREGDHFRAVLVLAEIEVYGECGGSSPLF
jgi:hypothetical protein